MLMFEMFTSTGCDDAARSGSVVAASTDTSRVGITATIVPVLHVVEDRHGQCVLMNNDCARDEMMCRKLLL